MRIALLLPLAAGVGCAVPASEWQPDVNGALDEAATTNRPLIVLSIVGDLRKRC